MAAEVDPNRSVTPDDDASTAAAGGTPVAERTHRVHWSRGGPTNLRDGTMLCPRHHTMVHKPGYLSDGTTRITRTQVRRR
jgi:hypothetical protein